jgi:UDP-N-acetylglucosamine--N-acetylmuramyl-(pentapeptide) pyrophosphoryl-undecaprenol N-acetylglucosamine transferase
MKKKILISTGGSGGHVIPATIFYEHLKDKFDVFISTDERGSKFINLQKYKIKIINTPKLISNLFLLPLNLFLIGILSIKSIFYLKEKKIDFLISTGGYMSLPLCIAAKILKIKIYLYEPNMILGRANSFFLKFSEKIFCYSKDIKNFNQENIKKIVEINPLLRKEFYYLNKNKNKIINDKINVLIIGGSQGARFFETEIRNAIITLSKKYKLKVFQQTSSSNFKNLKELYSVNNIENELFEFSENLSQFIDINFCITRAGASTLSELTFLKIPYLAIPYPLAKDDHQYHNAIFYKNKNCCWVLKQGDLDKNIIINNLLNIVENKEDYLTKKKNMENFSYQNTWNDINQKLIKTINEN